MSVFEDRGRFLNTCCQNGPVVFFGIVLLSIPMYHVLRSTIGAIIAIFNSGSALDSSLLPESYLFVLWHIFPFILFMVTFVGISLIVRRLQNAQAEQGVSRGGPAAGFIAAIGSPEPYARMYGSVYTSLPQAVQSDDSRQLESNHTDQTRQMHFRTGDLDVKSLPSRTEASPPHSACAEIDVLESDVATGAKAEEAVTEEAGGKAAIVEAALLADDSPANPCAAASSE